MQTSYFLDLLALKAFLVASSPSEMLKSWTEDKPKSFIRTLHSCVRNARIWKETHQIYSICVSLSTALGIFCDLFPGFGPPTLFGEDLCNHEQRPIEGAVSQLEDLLEVIECLVMPCEGEIGGCSFVEKEVICWGNF